jgi:ceramide glucosyltransferase
VDLSAIFGCLAVLSSILIAWQLLAGLRFPFHRRANPPEPDPDPGPDPLPGITILKPIKGCDEETESCLRSWFEQDYNGPIQILFGVAALNDPAVPIIERLIKAHPHRDAKLIHCSLNLAINPKVSSLLQLHQFSVHPFLCVSDADVWVPRDYVREAAASLSCPGVGLMNSFYQIKHRTGFGLRWEAFATNADFWSQVLQSATIKPLDFALGAAMVFRREPFETSGGFRAIADYLADDYQLGRNLTRMGLEIRLSSMVVECHAGPPSFSSAWLHQLRWARTIRTCEKQAFPYFLSILGNATFWPALWWLVAPTFQTAWIVLLLLSFRGIQGTILEHRLTRRWDLTSIPMAWIKDGLQVAIWLLAFLGRTVWWRDVRYRVDPGGKLTRMDEPPAAESRRAAG